MMKVFWIIPFILLCSCSSLKLTELDTSNYDKKCRSLGAKTSQGQELCRALERTGHTKDEIYDYADDLSDLRFDALSIFLGVGSAGALAADSHVSLLEGLGIATATTLGIKNYSSKRARRSVYKAGINALQCTVDTTKPLLWDDRWYYRLREHRFYLHRFIAELDKIKILLPNSATGLRNQIEALRPEAYKALDMAQQAVNSYGSLGLAVDTKRMDLLLTMREYADSRRGDTQSIVNSITQAKAIQKAETDLVNEKTDSIEAAAANSTPDGSITNKAQKILTEIEKQQTAKREALDKKKEDKKNAAQSQPSAQNAIAIKSDEEILLDAITKAKLKTDIDTNKKVYAATFLSSAAYSMSVITDIAPRYIKARSNLNGCMVHQ